MTASSSELLYFVYFYKVTALPLINECSFKYGADEENASGTMTQIINFIICCIINSLFATIIVHQRYLVSNLLRTGAGTA